MARTEAAASAAAAEAAVAAAAAEAEAAAAAQEAAITFLEAVVSKTQKVREIVNVMLINVEKMAQVQEEVIGNLKDIKTKISEAALNVASGIDTILGLVTATEKEKNLNNVREEWLRTVIQLAKETGVTMMTVAAFAEATFLQEDANLTKYRRTLDHWKLNYTNQEEFDIIVPNLHKTRELSHELLQTSKNVIDAYKAALQANTVVKRAVKNNNMEEAFTAVARVAEEALKIVNITKTTMASVNEIQQVLHQIEATRLHSIKIETEARDTATLEIKKHIEITRRVRLASEKLDRAEQIVSSQIEKLKNAACGTELLQQANDVIHGASVLVTDAKDLRQKMLFNHTLYNTVEAANAMEKTSDAAMAAAETAEIVVHAAMAAAEAAEAEAAAAEAAETAAAARAAAETAAAARAAAETAAAETAAAETAEEEERAREEAAAAKAQYSELKKLTRKLMEFINNPTTGTSIVFAALKTAKEIRAQHIFNYGTIVHALRDAAYNAMQTEIRGKTAWDKAAAKALSATTAANVAKGVCERISPYLQTLRSMLQDVQSMVHNVEELPGAATKIQDKILKIMQEVDVNEMEVIYKNVSNEINVNVDVEKVLTAGKAAETAVVKAEKIVEEFGQVVDQAVDALNVAVVTLEAEAEAKRQKAAEALQSEVDSIELRSNARTKRVNVNHEVLIAARNAKQKVDNVQKLVQDISKRYPTRFGITFTDDETMSNYASTTQQVMYLIETNPEDAVYYSRRAVSAASKATNAGIQIMQKVAFNALREASKISEKFAKGDYITATVTLSSITDLLTPDQLTSLEKVKLEQLQIKVQEIERCASNAALQATEAHRQMQLTKSTDMSGLSELEELMTTVTTSMEEVKTCVSQASPLMREITSVKRNVTLRIGGDFGRDLEERITGGKFKLFKY